MHMSMYMCLHMHMDMYVYLYMYMYMHMYMYILYRVTYQHACTWPILDSRFESPKVGATTSGEGPHRPGADLVVAWWLITG